MQTGAPGAPRRALLIGDGFQNLTSMLKYLEKNRVDYTEKRF